MVDAVPECVVTVVYEAFAVDDVLTTCPLAKGVCTYTVATRPETAVVVVVNAPVQAVVTVVNDTVAGAVWTGAPLEDDEDEVVDAIEEDDDLLDEATDDEVKDETIEADEEADEEDKSDEDELDAREVFDEDDEAELEEEATLDEDEEATLAELDETDVGRRAILDDEGRRAILDDEGRIAMLDDEGRTTAGQLLGFDLMLSATLVRLKYASILRIFNTLSARGGPCAQAFPDDQLFQIQEPGVVGTLSVIVCTKTPSMKNLEAPGTQSSLYSCQAVLASAGAATL
jgi:hypothetical protein